MRETETGDTNAHFGQFDELEFFGSENMDILRPCFFFVGRSRNAGIMVSRRDENADFPEAFELPLQKFESVGRDPFQFEKVPCD